MASPQASANDLQNLYKNSSLRFGHDNSQRTQPTSTELENTTVLGANCYEPRSFSEPFSLPASLSHKPPSPCEPPDGSKLPPLPASSPPSSLVALLLPASSTNLFCSDSASLSSSLALNLSAEGPPPRLAVTAVVTAVAIAVVPKIVAEAIITLVEGTPLVICQILPTDPPSPPAPPPPPPAVVALLIGLARCHVAHEIVLGIL
eukprot:CAMPEP_0115321284 /NCGR_PEP_ID=MMETSP0270-20121206/80777_1 /TAXON_ID=71861 /ORGANISM="Scrippsiella trochoidea, Strain CCMP3099" /LENGTH=203 /DNA_ID=CAMNT_0002741153 /DNA_START=27 /DNA_END=635 /DNA_ORIENTATION=+